MQSLKDRLPARLAADPIGSMRTESDLGAVADAIVEEALGPRHDEYPLWESSGRWLTLACLGYLRDWCPSEGRSTQGLLRLLRLSLPDGVRGASGLDDLFGQIRTGCSRSAGGTTTSWEASNLVRNDGRRPRDTNGIQPSEDYALRNYELFTRSAALPTRVDVSICLVESVAQEERDGANSRGPVTD